MNTNTNAAPDLKAVIAFLLGEGPLDGYHFGERAAGAGRYWWRTYLRAALSAAAQPPAEMVMVPVEPTLEMLDRGHHQIDFDRSGQRTDVLVDPSHADTLGCGTTIEQDMRDCWAAMLAAAPKAAKAEPAPREPLKFSQRKALAICTESQKVSVSEVQRKMQISYAAAQELCQSLVDYGGLVDGFALSPSLKPAQTIGEKP